MKLFAALFLAALSAQATTFYVTISGLGGEPDYDQRFKMLADDMTMRSYSFASAKIQFLKGGVYGAELVSELLGGRDPV